MLNLLEPIRIPIERRPPSVGGTNNFVEFTAENRLAAQRF